MLDWKLIFFAFAATYSTVCAITSILSTDLFVDYVLVILEAIVLYTYFAYIK